MADLNEGPLQYPQGIYQLENGDPIVGGAPNVETRAGMDNIPHLMLAQRTAWLRAEIDKLVEALDGLTADGILELLRGVDGPGSRLDADLLDGLEAEKFLRKDVAQTATGDLTIATARPNLRLSETDTSGFARVISSNGTMFFESAGIGGAGPGAFGFTGPDNADIETMYVKNGGVNREVWHAGNDAPLAKYADSVKAQPSDTSTTGYQRLPNGLIFQWGRRSGISNGDIVQFPITFPSQCFAAIPIGENSVGGEQGAEIVSVGVEFSGSFRVQIHNPFNPITGTRSIRFWAIGE